MKIVSQLDAAGYFIGPAEAHESPLEPGIFHVPGGAVDAEPPVVLEGHLAKWNGSAFVMELIVEPEPEPEPEPTPEQIQDRKNQEARIYLLTTDWYVVRHAETGEAIPQDILDARQAARDAVVEP